jgi:hypothetical protein
MIYCQINMKWCQPNMEDRYNTEVVMDPLSHRLG